MAKHQTPLLDELEKGPWPSFVTALKQQAETKPECWNLLGQLERMSSKARARTSVGMGESASVYAIPNPPPWSSSASSTPVATRNCSASRSVRRIAT